MRTWLRRIAIILLVFVLLTGALAFDFLRHGGQFRSLEPRSAGRCESIEMSASAEDIRIDAERGIAYLSFLDRRGQIEGQPVTGTVMLLDLNLAEPRPRAALLSEPPGFRPHGMSLYVPTEGRRRLFVINHPKDAPHEVAVFEETVTGAFALADTIRDPLLVDPNAIVAVGPEQFYVANDSGARNGFERAQELLLRRGLANVVYYDGYAMRVVAPGLKSPSGIDASSDRTRLYVAETSGNRVSVFRRDVVDGDLEHIGGADLGSAPDNIVVDEDDTVWIAAHARVLALVRSFANAANRAPTQVFAWRAPSVAGSRPEVVYLNLGDEISAGSVAAPWRERLLIGSITDRKVLLCTNPLRGPTGPATAPE
jgi:arylesterase/paraoxonase